MLGVYDTQASVLHAKYVTLVFKYPITYKFLYMVMLSRYGNYCFFQFHYRFLLPHTILNAIALIALVTKYET